MAHLKVFSLKGSCFRASAYQNVFTEEQTGMQSSNIKLISSFEWCVCVLFVLQANKYPQWTSVSMTITPRLDVCSSSNTFENDAALPRICRCKCSNWWKEPRYQIKIRIYFNTFEGLPYCSKSVNHFYFDISIDLPFQTGCNIFKDHIECKCTKVDCPTKQDLINVRNLPPAQQLFEKRTCLISENFWQQNPETQRWTFIGFGGLEMVFPTIDS